MSEDRGDAMKLADMFHSYVKGVTELPYMPMGVRIEPTNHCNIRCEMCPTTMSYQLKAKTFRPKGLMDMELFKRIIAQMEEFPKSSFYPHITLYLAGESLLHPKLAEMVAISKKSGFTVHLNTNCLLLTPEKSLELLDAGIDLINLSFDDMSKEDFEKFRAKSDHGRVLSNILALLHAKKSGNFEKTLVKIVGLRVTDNGNVSGVSDGFAELFAGLPLDGIDISLAHQWAGEFKGWSAGEAEAVKEYYPCHMLWRDLTIGWDGKILGCCYDLLGEEVIGDAKEDALKNIWNNARFQELRKLHQTGQYHKIKLCRGCELLEGRVNFWGFWKEFAPFVKEHMRVATDAKA